MKIFACILILCTYLTSNAFCANPRVTIDISGGVTGRIVLELYPDEAPITVENFVNYVHSGFYNGLIFHRVIPDFMIQCGGFDTELIYQQTNAPIKNESYNGLSNTRGTIAMARTGDPHSATSQFFINLVNNTGLDQSLVYDAYGTAYHKIGYTVFGEVISGMEIVDAIAGVTTEDGVETQNGTLNDVPVTDIIIESAVLSNPVCLEKMQGDIDGDCNVDMTDLALLAANWLKCNSITTCN